MLQRRDSSGGTGASLRHAEREGGAAEGSRAAQFGRQERQGSRGREGCTGLIETRNKNRGALRLLVLRTKRKR